MAWDGTAENVGRSPFISFVNELDYSSTSIPQKHPRNERVTSVEELGTMSKNNLRGITLGIRAIWKIHSLNKLLVFGHRNIETLSLKCMFLKCLSPLFVLYNDRDLLFDLDK